MTRPVLQVERLRKAFGALRVTDEVSLDLRDGELHAIIGPNGAGKTTLIHQIAGSLPSDGGRILYRGADIARLAMAERVRAGIARSFQITSILRGFTVLQNAAMAVQARSGSSFRFLGRADEEPGLNGAAMEALAAVGLADRAHHVAGTLSHGEKRRLEIALALATAPSVLLFDEPLAGTSHEESAALIALMRGLKRRYAIFLIEHDMNAVFALADRVSVLVYGRVIASGTPDDVRADPQVRAAYLGEEAA